MSTVALAGNPNVGKSSVFNALTGLKQHTGNWSGKTVSTAEGKFKTKGGEVTLVDLPGAYSLSANSAEEEVTRDFLCFAKYDAIAVVCDSCALERNLIFALQVAQLGKPTLLCVNMLDDARKKGIDIDLDALEQETGLPICGVCASTGEGIAELKTKLAKLSRMSTQFVPLRYPPQIKSAIDILLPVLKEEFGICGVYPVLKLIEDDSKFIKTFEENCGEINKNKNLSTALGAARQAAEGGGVNPGNIADKITACTVFRAEEICLSTVKTMPRAQINESRADKVLTSKLFGIPAMLLVFGFIFWLTVSGANYPSELLSVCFSCIGNWLEQVFEATNCPLMLKSLLLDGIWKVLSWVVAVMLPPMAIFFPLFTVLEDMGYLPRVAFNLDKGFCKAGACGKQALTMCMGLGCGAVGVTGARIIDSPRERLIAIITNSFVPCNGRLPALVALISMFFTQNALAGSVMLTAILGFSVLATLAVSKLLSKTVLKGVPASFTLELPPYRLPQIGKVIVRSVLDRTIKILGKAVLAATAAGVIIWLCSNIYIGQNTLFGFTANVLDPFAKIFGMDGVILSGFVFSLPANEIALPIMAMGYSGGELTSLGSMEQTAALFAANGFTKVTALCTIIFFLFRGPCATTLFAVWEETKSVKWFALSVLVPILTGFCLCFGVNIILKLLIFIGNVV